MQIQLQFLPLPTPGRLFDIGPLWRGLLQASLREDEEGGNQDVDAEFAYLQEMATLEVGTACFRVFLFGVKTHH